MNEQRTQRPFDGKLSLISFRALNPLDLNFILVSWLRALRFGNDYFRDGDDRKYYEKYQLFIKELLNQKETFVNVACLTEDPDVILGYAVLAPPKLHWVYIKKAWRNLGLAKKLVEQFKIETVTHLTKAGNAIRKKKGLRFDPYDAYKSVQE